MIDLNIMIVGAARGIGKTLAERCIERGHCVSVGLRRFGKDEQQMWESKSPGNVLALHTDACDEETLKQAAKKTAETFGEIDVVVYNAGVLHDGDRVNELADTDLQEMRSMIEVNAIGIISCFRSAYPYIPRNGHGKFIAITAGGGTFLAEDPIFPAYSVSKTAANKVVHILKNQIKDVEILAVHPGRVNTEMGRTTYQIELDESIDGLQKIVENPNRAEGWFLEYTGETLPI